MSSSVRAAQGHLGADASGDQANGIVIPISRGESLDAIYPKYEQLNAQDQAEVADAREVLDICWEFGDCSVTPASLPAALQDYDYLDCDGIVFHWEGLSIDQSRAYAEGVPQFRPHYSEAQRSAAKAPPKYLFAKGQTPPISVHQRSREVLSGEIAASDVVIFQEGTKQHRYCETYKPVGSVVVGIAGCWGWTADGVPNPDLARLGLTGKVAYVCFDGDVTSNRMVYDAATAFATALKALGAKSVSFVQIPSPPGSKAGLDDWLKSVAPDVPEVERITARRQALQTLLDAATSNLGKAPARATPVRLLGEGPHFLMSESLGACVEAEEKLAGENGRAIASRQVGMAPAGETTDGVQLLRKKTVAGFFARITRTSEVINDLLPSSGPYSMLAHDILIRIGDKERTIKGWPDADLVKTREMLSRVNDIGGPVAFMGEYGTARHRSEIIEAAIRSASADRAKGILLERTGWYRFAVTEDQTVPVYATPHGGHGPDGIVPDIASKIESRWRNIDLPSPTGHQAKAEESYRASLAVIDELVDPSPYLLGLGMLAGALSGSHARGCLYLYGEPASGKSSIMDLVAAHLGRGFAGGMVSLNSTAGSVGQAGASLHQCFCLVDDQRASQDPKVHAANEAGLALLVRRGYETNAVGRTRLRKDAVSGDYVDNELSPTSTAFAIVSEYLLDPVKHESSVQRLLPVHVTAESTFKTLGTAGRLIEAAKDGAFEHATSHYLRHLARRIRDEFGGDPARLERYVDERRAAVRDSLAERVQGLKSRGAEVASLYSVGLSLWLDAAVASGAVTSERSADLFELADGLILGWVRKHAAMVAGAATVEIHLAKLRDAVNSGRYYLAHTGNAVSDDYVSSVPGATKLGFVKSSGKDPRSGRVIIFPEVARSILGLDSSGAVLRTFRSVSIHGPGDRPDLQVRIGDTRAWCLALPIDVWSGMAEGEDGTP